MLFSRPLQIVTLSTQIDTIKSLFAISYVAFSEFFFSVFIFGLFGFFFKFIFVSSLFLLSQLFSPVIFFSCLHFVTSSSFSFDPLSNGPSSIFFLTILLFSHYELLFLFFHSFFLYLLFFICLPFFSFSLFLLFLIFFYIRFLCFFILYFFCFHSPFILPYFSFFFIQIIIFFFDIFLLVPSFHNINIQSSSFQNPAQCRISCFLLSLFSTLVSFIPFSSHSFSPIFFLHFVSSFFI